MRIIRKLTYGVFLLCAFLVCAVSASTNDWKLQDEIHYYQAQASFGVANAVYFYQRLDSAEQTTENQKVLQTIRPIINNSSEWLLLQFVNEQYGIYRVKLLFKKNIAEGWQSYSAKSRDESAHVEFHAISNIVVADKIFQTFSNTNSMIDFSHPALDGTTAFVTVSESNKLTRFAVYSPIWTSRLKEKVSQYAILSTLVESCDELK